MGTYVEYAPRTGGTPALLFFDVTLSESHEHAIDITEHPVEKGADVADHYRPKLEEISFDFFVSNAPIGTKWRPGGDETHEFSIPQTFNDPPLVSPPDVVFVKVWENPLPLVGFETESLMRIVSSVDSPKTQNIKMNVLSFTSEFDAVAETVLVLRKIRDNAMLCNVYSPHHDYTGFMLASFSMKRAPDDGTGATFSLKFKQVDGGNRNRTGPLAFDVEG